MNIEIIARGLLIQDGHILLCNGTSGTYTYLPGGHVELGETLTTALKREWQEELGCDCTIGDFLEFHEDFFTDANGEKHHEISFIFEVKCDALSPHKAIPQCESYTTFQWASKQQLVTKNVLPLSVLPLIHSKF